MILNSAQTSTNGAFSKHLATHHVLQPGALADLKETKLGLLKTRSSRDGWSTTRARLSALAGLRNASLNSHRKIVPPKQPPKIRHAVDTAAQNTKRLHDHKEEVRKTHSEAMAEYIHSGGTVKPSQSASQTSTQSCKPSATQILKKSQVCNTNLAYPNLEGNVLAIGDPIWHPPRRSILEAKYLENVAPNMEPQSGTQHGIQSGTN